MVKRHHPDRQEAPMRRLVLSLALSLPLVAAARPAQLEVKDAWARPTIGGSENAAVYMTITSPKPDRLIAASASVAKKTDLMTMAGDSSAMEMKYLKAIDIPANKPVILNGGGLHVWLAGVKQPLKAGQTFPLILTFEKAGQRKVTVSIVKPGEAGPMAGMRM
jgi:copper(I)-binding protein